MVAAGTQTSEMMPATPALPGYSINQSTNCILMDQNTSLVYIINANNTYLPQKQEKISLNPFDRGILIVIFQLSIISDAVN